MGGNSIYLVGFDFVICIQDAVRKNLNNFQFCRVFSSRDCATRVAGRWTVMKADATSGRQSNFEMDIKVGSSILKHSGRKLSHVSRCFKSFFKLACWEPILCTSKLVSRFATVATVRCLGLTLYSFCVSFGLVGHLRKELV